MDVVTLHNKLSRMESATLSASGFNFDFRYSDSDVILNELNELYSYSELDEMFVNARTFTDYVQKRSIYSWSKISLHLRQKLLYNLMEELELVDPSRRLTALQCLAYLLQGNFMECECDGDVERWVTYNAYLLYDYGFWPIFVSLFVHEYETTPRTSQGSRVQNPLTMKDSHQFRLIINCLYSTLEVLRRQETIEKCFQIDQHDDTERRRKLREDFLDFAGLKTRRIYLKFRPFIHKAPGEIFFKRHQSVRMSFLGALDGNGFFGRKAHIKLKLEVGGLDD
uniref:Far11/STRP N-terminal domain-containing protein n=1 Tax=Romanomermis culicivorax TaxID=13658 RepID=A0A915L489_ROMCU